ncbi:MAG: glycosyltransferase family 2 protein [Anaerolineaceae bacterium]
MDLSICTVSLNSKEYLRACLDSVVKHTLGINYELIVVDNGSTDGTQALLRESYPQVHLIENQTNLGFSKPTNQAFNVTKGEFILALNPDTLINDDCFSTQVAYLRGHPEVGVSIPKVLNVDGSFQAQSRRGEARPAAVFGYFLGLGKLFPKSKPLNSYLMSWLPEGEIAEVKAVSGSCMFIRRECWEQIDGFDEAFFAYQEDSDLCERARAKGWKVMYVPLSSVIHYGGQGGSKAQPLKAIYEWHRSYFLLYRKHYAKDYFFLFNWFYYAVMGIKLLLALLKNAIKRLVNK